MNQMIRILLAFLAIFALATATGAQQTEGRMDPTLPVSLTVVKSKSATDSAQVTPAGITFQAKRLEGVSAGTDLSTLDPQQLLSGNAPVEAEYSAVTVAITEEKAAASFGVLPRGVYLVTEVTSREGDVSMATVAPFLVALPYHDGTAWRYDVEVQAKNQPISVTKSADLTQAAVGEKIRYELRSTIPTPDLRGKLYRYVLQDDLAPQLSFRDGTVMELRTPTQTTRLVQGTDYVLHGSEKSFTIEFTDEGLAKLTAARLFTHKAEVRTLFDAEIVSAGVGQIPNTAVLFADGYTAETGGGVDSNTVNVKVTDPSTPSSDNPTVPPLTPSGPDAPQTGAKPQAPGQQPPQAEQTVVEKFVGQAKKGMQSLAQTGANVYTLSIIAALALFGGAVIIKIQESKRRKAEQ